jgi:hypothetical protein
LGDKPVKLGVRWSLDVEVLTADVVHGFVVLTYAVGGGGASFKGHICWVWVITSPS